MKRREFITLLGGAAVAWPLSAQAQQRERIRRVGVLMPFTADDAEGQARLLAFAQGLQELGWAVGGNVRIDTRWSAGDAEPNRTYAAELLALTPDVILANGTPEMRALQQVTRSVPIVFANVADPVGQGFVASLPRNITGFMPLEFGQSGKWLELLKEIAPHVTRAAVLLNRAFAAGIAQFGAIQAVAPLLGVEVSPIDLRDATQMEHAYRSTLALAEQFCRKIDRIDPAGVRRPRDRLGRGAPTPDSASLCPLLQRSENAPLVGQRCAILAPGAAERKHHVTGNPRRAASPLHASLSFRYRQGDQPSCQCGNRLPEYPKSGRKFSTLVCAANIS
jgi:hypothetical protein